jgi:tRNA (mo5U34)-methyltransferase
MSAEAATEFIARAGFVWYQRFPLAPGVYTPGASDVEAALRNCAMPEDLTGKTVLDVGTTNGGVAFALEARGAARVVAVDIYPPAQFGFDQLRSALRSRVQFVQASIYELASMFDERFDIVMFLGVLYHLRHPLLALDNVRALTRGYAVLETAVANGELMQSRDLPVARFYRDELLGDGSNWFVPTIACLLDWCRSSGLEPESVLAGPEPVERCLVRVAPTSGPPEYQTISYERPLRVRVDRASQNGVFARLGRAVRGGDILGTRAGRSRDDGARHL